MESMQVTPSEVIDLYNAARRRGFIAGVVLSITAYSIYRNFKSNGVLPQ